MIFISNKDAESVIRWRGAAGVGEGVEGEQEEECEGKGDEEEEEEEEEEEDEEEEDFTYIASSFHSYVFSSLFFTTANANMM